MYEHLGAHRNAKGKTPHRCIQERVETTWARDVRFSGN